MKWLVGLSVFLTGLLFSASPVLATDWQILGSQNERWQFAEQEVTAYSEHHFAQSWAISTEQQAGNFVFSFQFTPLQGADHNVVWNFLSEQSYYQAHFAGGSLTITRFKDGQAVLDAVQYFYLELGQTYAVVIEQAGSQLSIMVDGQSVVGLADWTHDEQSHGAVGFKLAPGTIIPVEARFTDIQVTSPDSTLLPVERILQKHTSWRYLEYDSASQWSSQPTIERWGCALTSLVMIMNYHGLQTMPDGQSVTPRTVNNWLQAQPDGYLGQGLVNWWAGTRLIREISDTYSTQEAPLSKLEFVYQAADWQTVLRAQLTAGHPAIVQVPGHFLVSHGFEQQTEEFFIQDPLYDYTRLSQHDPALSLRLFTPSQTDLSAIAVIHPADTVIEIKDEAGQVVSDTWQEFIAAPTIGQVSTTHQLTAVSKPAAGKYYLVFPDQLGPETVTIITYDKLAEPTFIDLPANLPPTLVLEFVKDGLSSLGSVFSWQAFLTALEQAEPELPHSLMQRIERLTNLAQQAPEDTWPRYQSYLKNILELAKNKENEEKITSLQALLS